MKSQIKSFTTAFFLIVVLSMGVSAAGKGKSATILIKTSAICESCKARVEKALKATVGVMEANLNLNNKKVKVKYDPAKLSENQVRLAITNAGYDADDMQADKSAYAKLPHCCQKTGGKCEHATE
jgi:mercuric ion binding protein